VLSLSFVFFLRKKDLLMWVYVLTVYFSFIFFPLLLFVFCFPPKRQKKIETIYFCVVCVCFSKRLVRCVFSKKKKGRKSKGDGIPCVFMLSNYLSTLSFCCFFSWVDAVFFFYAAAVCFFPIYLLNDCVRVCISFSYLLCVCV
jgi:hypothetical protein